MHLRKRLRPWRTAAALVSLGLAVAPASVASATSVPVRATPAGQNGGVPAAPVLPAARGGFFELVNPVFDRCVDVINGSMSAETELQEIACKNNDAQLWAPTLLGGTTVQWRNPFGFCLEAPSDVNGVHLIQNVCDVTKTGQQWSWAGADAVGHLVLVSKFPDKCMAFESSLGIDGTRMILANCATVASEMWRIDK